MSVTTWPDLLSRLVAGHDLDTAQTTWAMDEIMLGQASPARLAGFLVALRAKGETVTEVTALADTMLRHAVRIDVPGRAVDIVGSGGDRSHTVNISTMASLVIAAAGIRVVKHGNRASSSSSGSADVLEALGIRLDQDVSSVAALAEEVGITFCFAQVFHPSFRHAGVARKDLGIATTFNFLGPLTNPAQPAATAVGVADLTMAPLVAGVFAARGTDALVFRGDDGLDELAPTATSRVWEVRGGEVAASVLDATTDLGLPRRDLAELRGQDAAYNADVARRFFAGEKGAVRDVVLLNAAAAIVAHGELDGTREGSLADRLLAGMDHAARAVDSGAAENVLERWATATSS